jgi:hypothetical protein
VSSANGERKTNPGWNGCYPAIPVSSVNTKSSVLSYMPTGHSVTHLLELSLYLIN